MTEGQKTIKKVIKSYECQFTDVSDIVRIRMVIQHTDTQIPKQLITHIMKILHFQLLIWHLDWVFPKFFSTGDCPFTFLADNNYLTCRSRSHLQDLFLFVRQQLMKLFSESQMSLLGGYVRFLLRKRIPVCTLNSSQVNKITVLSVKFQTYLLINKN